MLVGDEFVFVRDLHILDACGTANGLEGLLTVMEDLGSIGDSFQNCQKTKRSLDGHTVRIGRPVLLIIAICAVAVTIAA